MYGYRRFGTRLPRSFAIASMNACLCFGCVGVVCSLSVGKVCQVRSRCFVTENPSSAAADIVLKEACGCRHSAVLTGLCVCAHWHRVYRDVSETLSITLMPKTALMKGLTHHSLHTATSRRGSTTYIPSTNPGAWAIHNKSHCVGCGLLQSHSPAVHRKVRVVGSNL